MVIRRDEAAIHHTDQDSAWSSKNPKIDSSPSVFDPLRRVPSLPRFDSASLSAHAMHDSMRPKRLFSAGIALLHESPLLPSPLHVSVL